MERFWKEGIAHSYTAGYNLFFECVCCLYDKDGDKLAAKILPTPEEAESWGSKIVANREKIA
jgi:hypothetical protein